MACVDTGPNRVLNPLEDIQSFPEWPRTCPGFFENPRNGALREHRRAGFETLFLVWPPDVDIRYIVGQQAYVMRISGSGAEKSSRWSPCQFFKTKASNQNSATTVRSETFLSMSDAEERS